MLLFIHTPLREYRFVWWGSVDGRTAAGHARGVDRHGIIGERNRLRGARVLELDENDTRMVWAKDFGIDLTADDQPIEPFPLPPHQH